jgi:hypothetical protein
LLSLVPRIFEAFASRRTGSFFDRPTPAPE